MPAEVASQDAPITFQSRVNLVLVPVVVRDKVGKPVGNLTKEDFQLFDKTGHKAAAGDHEIHRWRSPVKSSKMIAGATPSVLTIPHRKVAGCDKSAAFRAGFGDGRGRRSFCRVVASTISI